MSHDPANPRFTPMDVPAQGLETPHGYLYRPLSNGKQILVLIAAFLGGPAFGWGVAHIPGDLSQSAREGMCLPMVAIFFMGYSLWIARLNAIAFEGIGWGVLKALFNLLVFRRKPKSIHDVLPSQDKLLSMLVRAQKAGASFGPVGWLVGTITGLIAMLFDSEMNVWGMFLLVCGACVIWGYALAWMGRRGWLPFIENE